MGLMKQLDLSLQEIIFEGTLEDNIKENVGTRLDVGGSVCDFHYTVTKQDVIDYYNRELAREEGLDDRWYI
tara:strand:+ start:57 stop:269 length:213 start_codon:yes stop_codon:yes gene_type:complete